MSEHKDNGDVWTNDLWFGGELVGMVRGTQGSFLHNDHLARPFLSNKRDADTSGRTVIALAQMPDYRLAAGERCRRGCVTWGQLWGNPKPADQF